jgi:RNA polymerase sigma-70 factor (ECF subfamily)
MRRTPTEVGWETKVGPGEPQRVGSRRSAEPASDLRLLRAAQRGDGDAFVTLLEHHDRSLRTLAFRLLGDRGEMDDALQEVALKAFAALPRFRGDSSFGTWIHRIAYTTCLNRLRGLRRTVPLPDHEDCIDDAVADPSDALLLRVELAAALRSLTAAQRAVVALVLEEGFDHRTAAEVLGVPEGTVASRLAAARTTLRKLLREPAPHLEES